MIGSEERRKRRERVHLTVTCLQSHLLAVAGHRAGIETTSWLDEESINRIYCTDKTEKHPSSSLFRHRLEEEKTDFVGSPRVKHVR